METGIESLGPKLLEAFAKTPDPRNPSGRRHPLPAILTLAVCAMLANCRSLYAIHQWGREHAELAPGWASKAGNPRLYPRCAKCLSDWTKRLSRRCSMRGPKGNWATGRMLWPLTARVCGAFMAGNCPEWTWRRHTRSSRA